jgi:hypothetical protein
MKRVLTTTCMAIVCSAGVAMAQAPAYDKPQADKKIAENSVIVTGCVADKNAGGQYLLTNAVKSGATAATATTAPPAAAATGTTGTTSVPPALSFELWGGENLQAHLGHKVEITGTMDKADIDKIGKPEEKKAEMATSEKDVKALKLKVTAVKMIAAVCP